MALRTFGARRRGLGSGTAVGLVAAVALIVGAAGYYAGMGGAGVATKSTTTVLSAVTGPDSTTTVTTTIVGAGMPTSTTTSTSTHVVTVTVTTVTTGSSGVIDTDGEGN